MSQSIGLACDSSLTLDKIAESIQNIQDDLKLTPYRDSESGLYLSGNEGWYIDIAEISDLRNMAIENFIEMANSDDLQSKIHGFTIYHITFNDYNMIKNIIILFLAKFSSLTGDIWIDNNYGVVRNGEYFLNQLKNNPDWDWRSKDI